MTRQRLRLLFLGLSLCISNIKPTYAALNPSTQATLAQETTVNPRGLFNNYNIANVKIRTHDNLLLDGRIYEPKVSAFPGRRPTIIFTNSWTLGEYEYEVQARRFAQKGYIVLSYSSRGFGGSDGFVTVGGPNDIQDFSTVVDWLEDNTRVDVSNIGMAGVSLGGGMALLALGHEPRIKTAASMSGWGNLESSLYRNDTIQRTWLNFLVASGKLTGHLDQDIFDQIENMEKRTDIVATRAWAALRSPITTLDLINARKAPVFMENSYLDALFPPLQIKPFFDRIEGEKRMVTDEGIHASAAIPGILGLPSDLWSEVHNWMDHFLVDENIPIKTGLSFKTKKDTKYYSSYPAPSYDALRFTARNSFQTNDDSGKAVIRFRGNVDSGATSGTPVLSDALDTYISVPVKKKIAQIKLENAAVLESQVLRENLKVRGSSRVSFTLMPHDTPVMLVVYLYAVDKAGTGELESFSVVSEQDPSLEPKLITLDLNVAAFEIEKGQKVAVAIDTVDTLYTPATHLDHFVSIAADSTFTVKLPVVP
jgi:predicted acyl esterase